MFIVFPRPHLAVGMVRKATVDAAVIYLSGNTSSQEEEKEDTTHFQEEKVKRLVSIIKDSGGMLALMSLITSWHTVQMTI